jgi:hypothetical protein
MQAARLLAASWQKQDMPRVEVLFDEANVFRRQVLIVQGVLGNGMLISYPLQVVSELHHNDVSPSGKALELAKQTQQKQPKGRRLRRNSLLCSKAASGALYESLSNSFDKLARWSFSYTIAAAPLEPVGRGEKRCRADNGRHFIVDHSGVELSSGGHFVISLFSLFEGDSCQHEANDARKWGRSFLSVALASIFVVGSSW